MEKKYHDYKFGYIAMLNNNSAFKYETPYKGLFEITQYCINGTFKLECGTTKITYNICRIKPYIYIYIYDTNVEYIIIQNCV